MYVDDEHENLQTPRTKGVNPHGIMSDTCFICLEGGDVIYTCEPNTCHNLKAHERCLREHIRENPTCIICKVKYGSAENSSLSSVDSVDSTQSTQSTQSTRDSIRDSIRKVVCRVCILSCSTLISGMVSTAAFYATMLVRESNFFGFAICLFLASIILTLMNLLALTGAWKQFSQLSR